jgi:hypothetical protein
MTSLPPPPKKSIPTLMQWWGLCGYMIPRAILAYATGRASHARQVKGDDPVKKGYPGPPVWGLSVKLTTSPHKQKLLQNLKKTEEAKAHQGLQSR